MKAMAESRRMVQAGMEHETNSPMSTGAKKVVKAAVPVTDRKESTMQGGTAAMPLSRNGTGAFCIIIRTFYEEINQGGTAVSPPLVE